MPLPSCVRACRLPPPRPRWGIRRSTGILLGLACLALLPLGAVGRAGLPARAGSAPPPAATFPPWPDAAYRPQGVPLDRADWVITKDYAAHSGGAPWGAVDFAFWHNTHALGAAIHATQGGLARIVLHDPLYLSFAQPETESSKTAKKDHFPAKGQQRTA